MSAGPIDLSKSPCVTLRPVPSAAVQLQDTFWQPRLTINREVTLPGQLRHCEETGRLDNFRRAAGNKQLDFQGLYFNDSDVYKWAEAAAWSLATHPDPSLDAALNTVIQTIADSQQPDGYLNTYFMFEKADLRYTNLKDMHEIYCAGHLIQAAVAHHRATGKTTFLKIATRLADHLDHLFGPELGKRAGACGHEEAEMALVELYRTTGEARYLNLALFMIDARGRKPGLFGNSAYHQDHLPFTEQTEMTGHAVRHLYLVCGAADVTAEEEAPAYRKALENLWENFTTRRMYVTGAAGARHEGEAFGADYELPNARAYAETCAAIGSVMWNWRLLNITGHAKYADLMEHTLYNAVLPGLSLDGTQYFYENPLADRGGHRRQPWFGCACCPPNVARLLASLSGYFYSVTDAGVWTHLYAGGTATLTTGNGGPVTVTQQTNYPWEGTVEIQVEKHDNLAEFFYLRIPDWARGATVEVNGTEREYDALQTGGYIEISIPNQSVHVIRLTLPMDIVYLECHPHVTENRGCVALQRGPLMYCLEQADNPNGDVWDIALPAEAALTAEFVPDLLDGVTVLRGQGLVQERDPNMALYQAARPPQPYHEVEVTAIPYYAWANREPGPMAVWIPQKR